MEMYYQFLLGAIAMGFAAGGLFFLRFWRQTRDRLFLIFALSFWVLAVGRVLIVAIGTHEEPRTYIYLLRLFAFLLILVAIVDKNRARPRTELSDPQPR